MKAVVCTEYGAPEDLHLAEVKKPQPKENEILIRVHATTVGYGDLTARNFCNISWRDFNMPVLLLGILRMKFFKIIELQNKISQVNFQIIEGERLIGPEKPYFLVAMKI